MGKMTPVRKKRDSAFPSTDTGALKWYHINKRTKVIEHISSHH